MSQVELRVEPDLCGPVSVGTAWLVRLVSARFEISLGDALGYVYRAVFDGEAVVIPAPSLAAAERFVSEARATQSAARVTARLVETP